MDENFNKEQEERTKAICSQIQTEINKFKKAEETASSVVNSIELILAKWGYWEDPAT